MFGEPNWEFVPILGNEALACQDHVCTFDLTADEFIPASIEYGEVMAQAVLRRSLLPLLRDKLWLDASSCVTNNF